MSIRTNAYYELLDAMKERGCPLCCLLEMFTERYIDNLLYENVNDTNLRTKLVTSGGFCKEHSQKILRFGYKGYALGISILYKDLVDTFIRDLNRGSLTPNRSCIICEATKNLEDRLIEELIKDIKEYEFYQAYRNSSGLCMTHLSRVLSLSKDKETKDIFLEISALKLKEISDQLAEFIRKQDYRFREETIGTEGDSWIRAIEILKLR